MTTRPALRWAEAARLGLTVSSPRAAWSAAGALFALYALTMARSLTFYDSPELALVAEQLGVGHPIGQPLHTLVGFPFAHLPFASPTLGLTLMSALFGALSAIPAWSLSERLAPARDDLADRFTRGLVIVGVGASLVAWEPATRVEVYTLAAFLALWATARAADRGPTLGGGLALGLAAGAHAVVAVAQGIGLLPLTWARGAEGEPDHRRRAASRAVLGGLLGLCVYALVPLLAAGHPTRFAWGAPDTPARLATYLRGADYAHNQGIGLDDLASHVSALLGWGARHGTLAIALLGAAGLLALATRAAAPRVRALRWTLLLVILLDGGFVAANVVFHPDVPDYRGYFLAPLWLSGAGLAGLAAQLTGATDRRRVYGLVVSALPGLALLASPGHLAGPRDAPSLAETIARGALDESPRGAILVVEADHWVAPLLYLQEAEDDRPDVTVVAVGLSGSSWYWEHLFERHPDLAPVALAGPGGRAGRIRRLLTANPDRAVHVESASVAAALGLVPCGVGFLTDTRCADSAPSPDAATDAIDGAAPLRGESLEVAARIGEARGEVLWRLGHGDAAARAWLAGLSRSAIGPGLPADLPDAAPPLRGALPAWTQPAAIHDPARNLALVALLLDAMGHRGDALRYADAAIARGLPEAAEARDRIRSRRPRAPGLGPPASPPVAP